MEKLCQPTLNGRGGPISSIAIQARNFRLKNDMILQVQNSCQFHGLPGDDANKHLDKYLHVTQSIKVNGVTDDALHLYLFPHSLTHHATAWFDHFPRNSITTIEQMAKMFLEKNFPPSMVTKLRNEITNFLQLTQIDTFYNMLTLRHRDTINAAAGGTFMKRRPEECYDLIENITAHHNDWDTFAQRSELSSSITSFSNPEIVALKAEMPPLAKLRTYTLWEPIIKVNMFGQFMKMNTTSSSGLGTLPSNTITNLKEDLKGINTRSGNAYKGPMIPTTSSPPKVVERKIEVTKETVPLTNNESTKYVQPLPNPKPLILYSSRLHDEKLREKANDQKEKFFQIIQDLNFNISFADAPILMPKFGPTIKSLLTNKEKLFELARIPMNEHCSMLLLKKLPEKLGDPGKFLIPCDFSGMDECLALADLGASINPMPLSVWKMLSLPEQSSTCMTLELADRSISRPVGVAKDVSVKVRKFHFPADFVVTHFDADPRVSLILGRSFLKTEHAFIDVYKGELTLRVGKEAVTFNLDQTSRYSSNYDDMSVNQIDIIDVACKEYSQEVLGISMSGSPTPSTEPIVSISSPTLTPFGDSDFILEEIDAFLAIEDEPISQEIDDSFYDSKGDIILLERFLNDDPSSTPLLPQELKGIEPKNEKSSIDEPPVVELKDLPPHLEHAFLEGDDKLPVIIAKDSKDEEKTALIRVLKSHKEKFCNGMKCLKIPSKFVRFSTYETSISWGRSRLYEGTSLELPVLSLVIVTSRQVEVSNCGLKRILERTVGENRASWLDKLDGALWAFRIAFKTPIGCTPYKLVYRKACHLPIELEHKSYQALKHCNYDLLTAGDH
nr:reverse transcriptase domain-containing protein [Tanacetum cinerariifolium]